MACVNLNMNEVFAGETSKLGSQISTHRRMSAPIQEQDYSSHP
jgi:hypothetical protein